MTGVLVVDKPRGPTSHDVVARIRRALKTREVGHAGTLDPMASGVLVVAIGEATKLVPYLTNAAKEYTARLELGRGTDTLDALGKVIVEEPVREELLRALDGPVAELSPLLERAIASELARTEQEPPAFSAIQQAGERAYAKARRGEVVVLPPRPVRVRELAIVAMGRAPGPWLELRVKADKGYYVRALGRDLAHALGTEGMLTALRRIDSGGFTEAQAVDLSAPRETLLATVIPLADAARRALPSATLTDAGVVTARFGRRVPPEEFAESAPPGETAAWFDPAGCLVAIGVIDEGTGRVIRGFACAPV